MFNNVLWLAYTTCVNSVKLIGNNESQATSLRAAFYIETHLFIFFFFFSVFNFLLLSLELTNEATLLLKTRFV